MAIRFMRLDLSDEARDFRPVALEPGVPMLDRSNANAKIIFRWLGGMVAEPAWSGDSVDFFVRDDHGGRLEEVVCQPVAAEDLDKLLKADLEKLRQRHRKAKPETPTERAVKKMLRQSFESTGGRPDPQRPRLLLLPVSRRAGTLAAGLVLGLSPGRPGDGRGRRLRRTGVQPAVRAASEAERQVP